jgi:2-iminoacetate synthase
MAEIIDEKIIAHLLKETKKFPQEKLDHILQKALTLKGLSLKEAAALLTCNDPNFMTSLFAAAHKVKETIYGKRLVLFAPLYVSNYCINNCLYCGFRKDNRKINRKVLSQDEIKQEVLTLEKEGHKRILLVAGEDPKTSGIACLEKTIATIYATKVTGVRGAACGEIRRLNVNAAPMSLEEFKRLKKTGIGTYQLFQETYHRPTYEKMHPAGPKKNYARRLEAIDLAMQAGINDVGIGVLWGLYDWRFEVLALLQHTQHLEEKFGVGPHTISVPRLEPAEGAPAANKPPHKVSDNNFKKLVAILRLAVPYTGMILSTREKPKLRDELFGLGISQISAGSRTNPGGYTNHKAPAAEQFLLFDTRSLLEVIKDMAKLGYIPSFCTACYRLGRTGEDFMELAKPGLIQKYCLPNALLTFKEYLIDFGDAEAKTLGEKAIKKQLEDISVSNLKRITLEKLTQLEAGKRDLYF